MKPFAAVLLAVLLLVASGCNGQTEPQQKKTLKIAFQNEEAFYRNYGDFFDAIFPDVDVQIIPYDPYLPNVDPLKETTAMIDRDEPDLMIIYDNTLYSKLAMQGKLYDITGWVEKQYDAERVIPSAMETLRNLGDGKLYGLAPFFSAGALFYNKTLFDRYKVPYPTDRMSWKDVLTLAERFSGQGGSGDKQIFGYHQTMMQKPFDLISRIAQTDGLTTVDGAGERVTMDTEPWRKLVQMVVDSLKRGLFKTQQVESELSDKGEKMYSFEALNKQDLFSKGQAAMTIGGPDLPNSLKKAGFEWDVVTEPVDPANPDRASFTQLYPIFCISANAKNPKTAFEAIRYFNGDDYAKINAKVNVGFTMSLSTREGFTTDRDGNSLDVYYKLQFAPARTALSAETLPQSFYEPFYQLIDDNLGKVLDDKQSVEETLADIQKKGQALLEQAKSAENPTD